MTVTTKLVFNIRKDISSKPFSEDHAIENINVRNKNTAFLTQAPGHIVIELEKASKIKALSIANNNSGFIRVRAVAEEHEKILNFKNICGPSLPVLIPTTQLLSYKQHKLQEKIDQPRTFRKFSKYVNKPDVRWRFLIIDCYNFRDSKDKKVGVTWIQIFGSIFTEESNCNIQSSSLSPKIGGKRSWELKNRLNSSLGKLTKKRKIDEIDGNTNKEYPTTKTEKEAGTTIVKEAKKQTKPTQTKQTENTIKEHPTTKNQE